jgi:carbon monoxide dehydrogenase subunit G
MKIETSFVVPGEVATVWPLLADLEAVERVPGALIHRRDRELVEGRFQVTIGALAMSYAGRVKLVTRDERAHRLVLSVRGEDDKGRGRISGDVVLQVTKETASETRCAVLIDLDVTGAPATVGGRAVESVSRRLTDEFAYGVRELLRSSPPASRAATDGVRGVETTTTWHGWRFNASTMVRPLALLVIGACIAGTLVTVIARRMDRKRR